MRKEIIEKILEEWNVCSCDNSALADRLLEEFSPAGEYIKKEDALKAICKFCPCGDNGLGLSPCRFPEYCISDELKELNGLPTYSFPDSAENKGEDSKVAKGQWIKFENGYKCSECGHIMDKVLSVSGNLIYQYSNYCPECGKKMSLEEPTEEEVQAFWLEAINSRCM